MTASQAADLDALVRLPRPRFDIDVPLTVPEGGVTALLGPNAAGKTSVVRALAGLEPLRSGHVRLGGEVIEDPVAQVRTPARDRRFGYVFQDHVLFPRLTVVDNVAFGLRSRGASRAAARQQASTLLRAAELSELEAVRPAQLSGGQSQRVALLRALVLQPRLLLLDEPMAALDVGVRASVRSDLRRHISDYGGATVLVTHDPLDALVLADQVLVLDAGRVIESGTPGELARRPRTDYVARLMGVNLLAGVSDGSHVSLSGGGSLAVAAPLRGPVHVAVRPAAVTLFGAEPAELSARNLWPAIVTHIESRGDVVRVELSGEPSLVADITSAAVADLRLSAGARVWCALKATELDVYPRSE